MFDNDKWGNTVPEQETVTSELPPLTSKKIDEIREKLNKFPRMKECYGEWLDSVLNEKDPRTYPIIKQLLIKNYNYLDLIEQVLEENSTINGFSSVIKQSKNKEEFYDALSVLKFGKILREKGYNFEFIPPGQQPNPDIKARIWNKDVFFEIKHLRDIDEAKNLLFDFFNEYPSKFFVSITLDDAVTQEQIHECIQTIKTVMETKKEEDFPQSLSLGYANIKIELLQKQNPKTHLSVIMNPEIIPFERTKFKIETTFQKALTQFTSISQDSPCFIIYDIDNWKIDYNDLKEALYGHVITCITLRTLELQKHLYSLEKRNLKINDKKIIDAFEKGFYDILRETLLIPHFSYSLQNGLFFKKESEVINGVVTFRSNEHKIFPNPFVKNEKLIAHNALIIMF